MVGVSKRRQRSGRPQWRLKDHLSVSHWAAPVVLAILLLTVAGRAGRSARLLTAVAVLGGLILGVAGVRGAGATGASRTAAQDHVSIRTRASSDKVRSRPGPDGALWLTNPGNNSSGGSPPPGSWAATPSPSISGPGGIAAGPDGALWFTNNANNSIGRITTAGVVSKFTDPGISEARRVSRSVRTGRCGSQNNGNNSIGRITTTGEVANYPGTGICNPNGIVTGPDEQHLLNQRLFCRRFDRPDQRPPGW